MLKLTVCFKPKIMKKYLLIIFICISITTFAQENILFEHYTINDGISQSTINEIIQDSEGLIWFATYDGLNKFDGYNFTVYRNDPDNKNSLCQNYIICLAEDAKGRIWIGSYNKGIDIYDKNTNTFTNYRYDKNNPKSLSNNQIKFIFKDSKNNMWIATGENGVNMFIEYNERFIRYVHNPDKPNSLPFNEIFSLNEDIAGNILVGGSGPVYAEINPNINIVTTKTFTSYPIEGIAQNTGNIIFIDSKNKKWIGTEGHGLFRETNNQNEFIRYSSKNANEISNDIITEIFEDKDNNLWIGTNGGGITFFERKTEKFYQYKYDANNAKSISSNAIYAIMQDFGGSIWVGTFGAGLNVYNKYKLKFTHYNHNPLDPNSLSYKSVMCIIEDSQGDIWLGTDGGGFDLFDKDKNIFIHHKHNPENPRSNPSPVIITIYEDSRNNFWMGTYARGLLLYDRNTNRYRQFLPNVNDPAAIGHQNVWAVYEDSDNNLWIGLMGGGLDIYNRNTNTFKHYRHKLEDETQLSNPNIKCFFEDSRKNFWIGTEGGGLNKYLKNTDNFKRYMFDELDNKSISNNDIRYIFEDSKNNLWIGTGGGLNIFDYKKETFYCYSNKDGLPSNVINGILEDNNGNLWLSTNNGISRFNPENKQFRNYGISDGLQGREFNYTCALNSSNGDMYFGGINGFNVFNPNKIKDNPYKPPVIITDFKIFNNSYSVITKKINDTVISKSISNIKEIELTYKENVISFEFAALDFASPDKNKYKYMLEGFDEEWTETDASKRFASYTNLDGGEYYFKVKASNNDGVWNDKGITIKIIVHPPFWKTWWFRISLASLLIILFIIIYRYRVKLLKQEKVELEQKINDAVVEIENKKQELEEQNKELILKKEDDERKNWASRGLAMFSDTLRKNDDSINKMSQALISELIKYIDAIAGGFWVKNINEEGKTVYELKAISGLGEKRFKKKVIYEKEELIGSCAYDKKTVCLTDIPEDYVKIESGLGKMKVKFLLIIPLIVNEQIFGVIELASINKIPKYKIEFTEELCEKIAGSINAININEQTKKLLEKTEVQASELQSSEEELRQNLEEMQATQEQNANKEKLLLKEIETLKGKLKKISKPPSRKK